MSAEVTARDLVRSIIAEGVIDPTAIAEKAMAAASEDAFAEAAFHGFQEIASKQHRSQRGSAPSPSSGSGWEAARQASHDHTTWAVWVPDVGWKVLGDCSADEVRAVAQHRWAESERLSAWARWYDALADHMEREGASTVADLPPTKVVPNSTCEASGASEQEGVA